jgi:hypothetical protein
MIEDAAVYAKRVTFQSAAVLSCARVAIAIPQRGFQADRQRFDERARRA